MNDIEKAITYLKKSIQYVLDEKDEPFNETEEIIKIMNTAISALEKQLNGGWILFEAEYDRYFKMDMLQGEIPEEEQEILVTDGENVWVDTFMRDGMECYLDSGSSLVDKVTAWQPLPPTYKEVEQ